MNRIRDPCGTCKAARPSHRMVAGISPIVCASCDRCRTTGELRLAH